MKNLLSEQDRYTMNIAGKRNFHHQHFTSLNSGEVKDRITLALGTEFK